MSISIENENDRLEISDIDKVWNEVIVYVNYHSMKAHIYINHEDASKIIAHLKQQFEL